MWLKLVLFGCPTLTNNLETLFWVRDIIEKGAKWFAEKGPMEIRFS